MLVNVQCHLGIEGSDIYSSLLNLTLYSYLPRNSKPFAYFSDFKITFTISTQHDTQVQVVLESAVDELLLVW